VSKFTLALAAVALLPLLQVGGFQAGQDNPDDALILLSLLYGALPCSLKLVAILLLATTQIDDSVRPSSLEIPERSPTQ